MQFLKLLPLIICPKKKGVRKLKYIASFFIVLAMLFVFAGNVLANPTNEHKAQYFLKFVLSGNKNVVSYYFDGRHEIPGEPNEEHFGEDLVMKAGNSGNFHQWFLGWSEEESYHGEHSLWLVKRGPECPDDFLEIPDANPEGDDVGWGDHFPEGADYCVKTNDYKLGNWWEHQDLPWTIPGI